jgi:signal transduction histidine kinase
LGWLAPGASSLVALAKPITPRTWAEVRTDPGAVLLIVRQLSPRLQGQAPPPTRPSLPTLLDDPAILEGALGFLSRPAAERVAWDRDEVRPVYHACLEFARHAEQAARHTGLCDPEEAWVCGLLAPLGWLAVCAVDPAAAPACLADPGFSVDPAGCQRRLWGADHAAIARRLARAWQLPSWLAVAVGHPGLPGEAVRGLGADLGLLEVVRSAVAAAKEGGTNDLGFSGGQTLGPVLVGRPAEPGPVGWQDPFQLPWLADLLSVAAENRRLRNEPSRERLERDLDALQLALEEQVRGAAEQSRMGKLLALAEFAAGASHEINNPLAVISGQAQYLLSHEPDWFPGAADGQARRALEKIISQTRRIHGILRDLMQYARPPAPRRARVDVPALLGEVAASQRDLADQRRVRVEVQAPGEPLAASLDAEQVRTALSCLLRNAVEAAPADGWARLRLRTLEDGAALEVAVEDNGPGPDPAQRASLFDPFFSGRSAGRGRGLGLPIAWRLIRLHGGDVRLEATRAGEPTRFLVLLPRAAEPTAAAESPEPPTASPRALAAVNGRHCA